SQSIAPGVDVAAQVAKIDPLGFLGAGESAHLNPGFTGTKPQPYYRFYNTSEAGSGSQRDFLRASEYGIDYYGWDGDPRVDYFYAAPSGGHEGIPFGTPSGDNVPTGDELSNIRGIG